MTELEEECPAGNQSPHWQLTTASCQNAINYWQMHLLLPLLLLTSVCGNGTLCANYKLCVLCFAVSVCVCSCCVCLYRSACVWVLAQSVFVFDCSPFAAAVNDFLPPFPSLCLPCFLCSNSLLLTLFLTYCLPVCNFREFRL